MLPAHANAPESHPENLNTTVVVMTAYENRAAVAKLGETDPELAEFLKNAPPNPLASASFGDIVALAKKMVVPEAPTTPTEYPLELPVRDGRTSRARVYKPSSPPSSPSPLVILLYGGGFCLGDPTATASWAKAIAATTGAVVVAPRYRLAPDNPFPAAPHDVWDALAWLSQPANASTLGVDLSAGFVIGGFSAGANLAAAAAQRYVLSKSPSDPPLTGLLLSIPALLDDAIVPPDQRELWFSREQNAHAMTINAAAMEWINQAYRQDVRSTEYSPFNYGDEAHVGMPPTYVQVCGQDPLRDDGLVYERVLRAKGVKTRLDVYPGVPHGHAFTFPTLKSAVQCNADFVKAAAWALGRDLGDEEAKTAYAEAVASLPPPPPPRPSTPKAD